MDRASWPEVKSRYATIFKTKTRDEWLAAAEGTDACLAPVLSMAEAPHNPHNVARGVFVEVGGVVQPAPARASTVLRTLCQHLPVGRVKVAESFFLIGEFSPIRLNTYWRCK